MAYLVSQCRSRVFLSGLFTRTSLVTQIPARTTMTRSVKYPDYSVLFSLEKVQSASRMSRMKRHATLFLAAGVPSLYLATNLGYIYPDTLIGFSFWGAAITVILHGIGFLFNNVIGFIYINDDKKSAKISHVNYWGDRIDVDTAIDDIYTLSDSSEKFAHPLYHVVRLANSNKKYKLYIPPGKILDEKIFDAIFGQTYKK